MGNLIIDFMGNPRHNQPIQHAIIDICAIFGFSPPWFNDDCWLDETKLYVGSVYRSNMDVPTVIRMIKNGWGDCILSIDFDGDKDD